MTEFVDGHRWPQKAVSPDPRPSVAPDAPAAPVTDQREQQGADLPDFPAFTVHAGYVMRPDTVALHFHVDTVPTLAGLFPAHADALHAAALDVEMEQERQQDLAYERRPA